MAVDTWAQDFLREQYQKLGLAPGGTGRISFPKGTQRRPETAPFPELGPEPFQEQQERLRLEGDRSGLLQTIYGVGGDVVTRGLDLLMSVEYAIAGAAKALHKGTDPVEAFFGGISAAFHDDEKYKVTMYDLLGELGVDPKTWYGKTGKFVLGLGMGMAVDPLTWLSYGALRGSKYLSGTFFEEASGIVPVLKKNKFLRKGQWINPNEGKRFFQYIEKANAKKLAGKAGLLPIDQLDEMAKAPYRKFIKTLFSGQKDEFTDIALKMAGNPAGDAKWLAEEGFKKFLDPGGLNFGFPFSSIAQKRIWEPSGGVMSPRSSGFFGALAGGLVKQNKPLSHRMVETVTGNKVWETFVSKPVNAVMDSFGKNFRAYYGMTAGGEKIARQFKSINNDAKRLMDLYMGTIMTGKYGKMVPLKVGNSTVEISTMGFKPLSTTLDNVAGQLGFDSRVLQKDGEELADWIRDILTRGIYEDSEYMDMARKFRLNKLTTDEIEAVVDVVRNVKENVFPDLLRVAEANGIPIDRVHSYWAHYMAETADLSSGKGGANVLGGNLPFTKKSVANMTYQEMKDMPLGVDKSLKQILGHPERSLSKTLKAYTYGLFREIRLQEMTDEMVNLLSKHAIWAKQTTSGAFDTTVLKFLREAEVLAERPELALQIANAADGAMSGLPARIMDKWNSLFKAADMGTPEHVREAVKELAVPRGIGKTGQEYLLGRWQAIQKTMERRGKKDIVKVMDDVFPDLNKLTEEGLLKNELNKKLLKDMKENFPSIAFKGDGMLPEYKDLQSTHTQLLAGLKTKGYLPNKEYKRYLNAVTKTEKAIGRLETTLGQEVADLKRTRELKARFLHSGLGNARNHQLNIDRIDDSLQALYKRQEALGKLYKDIPRKESLRDFMSQKKRITRIANVEKKLREVKVGDETMEQYLPSLLEHISSKKGLDLASDEVLDVVEKLANTKGGNDAIRHFLEEPVDQMTFIQELGRTATVKGIGKVDVSKIALPEQLRKAFSLDEFKDMASRDDAFGALWRGLNALTNPLKKMLTSSLVPGVPRVAFFARNKLDLFVRPILDMDFTVATSRKFKKQVGEMLLGKTGAVTLRGIQVPYQEILDRYFQMGAGLFDFARVGTGRTFPKLERMLDDIAAGEGPVRNAWRKFMGNLSPEIKQFKPGNWGAIQENAARLEKILHLMDKGETMDGAVTQVLKTFFDYNNLTGVEKSLSSLVMFYNFNRQAVPYVFRVMMKNPEIFTGIKRLKEYSFESEEDKALMPKWMRDFPFFKIKESEGKFTVASLRNVFTVDTLGEIFPKDFQSLIGRVNPLLTIWPELQMGRDLYFGKDIERVRFLHEPLSELSNKTWATWLNLEPRELMGYKGKKFWAVDGYKYHLLMRTHLSRFFRDLDRIGQVVEARGGREALKDLLTLATGVKIYELGHETQRNIMDTEARRGLAEYKRALRRGDAHRAREILDEIRVE